MVFKTFLQQFFGAEKYYFLVKNFYRNNKFKKVKIK